jgi:hypothetical protein
VLFAVDSDLAATHATFAGAWATMLKAFFNTNAVLTNTVPNANGTAWVPYTAMPLTAGNPFKKFDGTTVTI